MRNPVKAFVNIVKNLSTLPNWNRAYTFGNASLGAGDVFDSVWTIGGVEATAQALSSLPIKFKDKIKGTVIERPTVEQKQWMHVIMNPDVMIASSQLWELTSMLYDIEGSCIWVLMKEDGSFIDNILSVPEKIMAYSPRAVTPIFSTSNANIVTGWKLTDKMGVRFLQSYQVVRFWKTNPVSYVNGLKLTDKIGSTLALGRGAKSVNRGFFANGAKPSGVITATKNIEEGELTRFGKAFSNSFASSENAGKIPVLPNGLDFKPFESIKDMDFKNLSEMNRDEEFGATRVPKHHMGVNDNINFATAEVLDRVFWLNVIKPKASLFADIINNRLLLGTGMEISFCFEGIPILEIDDMKVRLEKIKIATHYWKLGYAQNDINALFGLGMPVINEAWASKPHDPALMPNSLQPAVQNTSTDATKQIKIDSKPFDNMEKSISELLTVKSEEPKDPLDLAYGNAEEMELFIRSVESKTIEPLIAPLTKVMESYFRRLEKSQVERIKAFLDGTDFRNKANDENGRTIDKSNVGEVLFNEPKWNSILISDVGSFHLRAYVSSISQVKSELGGFSLFQETDQLAVDSAKKLTSNIVGINSRLRENIKQAIIEQIQNSGTRADILEAVQNQFSTSFARANTIARTETGIAMNTARWDAISAEVETKQWVSANDSHVRPTHREYSHMGSKPMYFEYAPGLEHPQQDTASVSEIVNCRCVLVIGRK
jgi:HK97 family phage portal protein